jgi:hypothetical protein
MSKKKGELVGKIILEIEKVTDEDWYSRVTPVMLTQNTRDYLKLGLITAAVQQYMRDSLSFINNIVKNSNDLNEMKIHLQQGKIDPVKKKKEADVDKYQQPLPLGKEKDEIDTGST